MLRSILRADPYLRADGERCRMDAGSGAGSVNVIMPHLLLIGGGTVVLLLVFERVVHALSLLLVSLIVDATTSSPAAKAEASRGLVMRVVDLAVELLRAWVQTFAGLLQWCIYYVPFFTICVIVIWTLGLFQEANAELLAKAFRAWNGGIGTTLRSLILVPLQLLNLLLTTFVPFWNVINYFLRGLVSTVILPMLQEGSELVLKCVTDLEYLFRSLASAASGYAPTLGPCTNAACLAPGARTLDLLSPMLSLRLFISHALLFLRGACGVLTPLFDALAYPLLDANFAQSVHLALNVPLYTIIQLPLQTNARCSIAANMTDDRLRGLACTPDVAPVFNMAAASSRHAGRVLDNWLDVIWIILLTAFDSAPPPCMPSSLAIKEITETQLFGGNETRIVGLGPTAYALTDGETTQFNFVRGPTETILARDHWPIPIKPAYGIAAVQYDEAEQVDDTGRQTMSLLGCNCYDVPDDDAVQGTRMEIHCAIARYQAEDADEALDPNGLHVPVDFALRSTAKYMTCAGSKIVVDSVRWPVSRLAVPGSLGAGGRNFYSPLSELASDKGEDSPEEVDAVIWVQPACAAEGAFDEVCARTFKDAACFPYCMAARPRGSGSQGMTLYNADDWQRRVQLQGRDCAVSQLGTQFEDGQSYVSEAPSEYTMVVTDKNDPLGRSVVTTATFDPSTMSCVAADAVASRVTREAVADIGERYEAVLLDEQPFAVAGSAALTAVYKDDGSYAIKVQRLYGEEGAQAYSLVTTHDELPAIAPCETLDKCDEVPRNDRVSIPYPWTASPGRHNPAVETRWGMFYAVNPSLDMFSEFAKYCQGRTDYKLQIQALSSYGGIRIWRLDAFAHSEKNGKNAARGASVEMPEVFLSQTNSTSICGSAFNVMVTSMEWLSEENIAITVLHAAPAYLDMRSLKPLGNDPQKVRYRTYFLNPLSLQLRENELWRPDQATSQLAAGPGTLCPDWRNMPQFGSMLGELGAAASLGARTFVSFLLAAPVVMQNDALRKLRECPAVPLGHSLLLNCGRNLLSLDDSFAAMRKANSHFWMVLAKLGRLLSGLPGGDSLHTFLQGMAVVKMQRFTALLRRRDYKQASKYTARNEDYLRGQIHEYALQQFSKMSKVMQEMPGRAQQILTRVGADTAVFARNLLEKSKEFLSGVGSADGAAAAGNGMLQTGMQMLTSPPQKFMMRLPGASVGMKSFGASVLDVGQFFWRMMTRLLLTLLARDTTQSLSPLLWQSLVESKADFREFFVMPAMRTCSGMGLMLGYSTPYARLVRESCSAVVAMQETMVTTVEIFFVQVPVLACLCRDTEGQNFNTFVIQHCWTPAPEHMKPLITALLSRGLQQSEVCREMGNTVEDHMRALLDPALEHAYKATQASASMIDYVTILFDADAGNCADLLTSPQTMALVPEPIDYFRSCGNTRTCRAACLTAFTQFEELQERLLDEGDVFEMQQDVEMHFFSAQEILDGRAAPPFEVLALLEIPVMDISPVTGRACCGGVDARDRCIAATGVNAQLFVEVIEYCVPTRLTEGAHEHVRWQVARSNQWSTNVYSIAFATREYLVVSTDGRVMMYRENGDGALLVEQLPAEAQAFSGAPQLHTISWMLSAPRNFVLIHGFIRKYGETFSEPQTLIVRLDGPRAWPHFYPYRTQTNLYVPMHGHTATCLGEQCGEFLLLPTTSEGSLQLCRPDDGYNVPWRLPFVCTSAALDSSLSKTLGLNAEGSTTIQITQALTPARRRVRVAHNTLSLGTPALPNERRVFISSPLESAATWLQEARIEWDSSDTSIATCSKGSSQRLSVDVKVKRRCDIDDCTGCKIPSVQRACYAAQQCAVANCIGTVVNLERPLCTAGSLLQTALELDLVKLQGIWIVIADLMIFVLRSATGRAPDGSELEALDDIFMGLICEAKDGIIASMAVLTSLINSIIGAAGRSSRQTLQPTVAQDQQAANADAVRVMIAAGTTNFLAQLSLAVLYVPIVAKKSIFCASEMFLGALTSGAGYELRLESKRHAEATNSLVSRCLSEYHREAMQDAGSPEAAKSFQEILSDMVNDGATAVATVPFEATLHTMDAAFSYTIGVFTGLQDLVAAADQKHCNLPDVDADEIGTCACGDTPVQIPPTRAGATVVEGGLWCQGVLSLMSSTGEPYLALNPYTYAELTNELRNQDAYLQCISSGYADGCAEKRPGAGLPLLARQGVSVFTAAVRCKSNYANSVWDEGAAALFAEPLSRHLEPVAFHVEELKKKVEANMEPAIVACLKQTLVEGAQNDVCLQDFLTLLNIRRQLFFEYIPIPATLQGTQHIAACQVFTGPAALAEARVAAKFAACLDDADAKDCTLPPMVWAGRSSNRVPVASPHAMATEDDSKRAEVARREHMLTYERVRALLQDPELTNWKADALDLSLFTAEGDALHQLFDALILGPFAKAELWPRDAEKVLPTLEWFRDSGTGATREFELPCTGDALRNVTSAPYTCGSDARRAAIRYFIRDVFFGKNERSLKDGVEKAVRELLEGLQSAWGLAQTIEAAEDLPYGCTCVEGAPRTNDVTCCDPNDTESFLPSNLQAQEYSKLRSESLVRELFELAGRFVERGIFSRAAEPFSKYSQAGVPWGESNRRQALALGVMRAHAPLLAYDESEVAAPLGRVDASHQANVSLWAYCHGLLQQSIATIPLVLHSDHAGKPLGLDTLPEFDPMNEAGTSGYASALEAFADKLTREAWQRSPLYHSHVMRHLPSDSMVCESWYDRSFDEAVAENASAAMYGAVEADETVDPAAMRRDVVDGVDVLGDDFVLPPLAWLHPQAGGLGSAKRACLCGWVAPRGACAVPRTVCDNVRWEEQTGSAATTLTVACALADTGGSDFVPTDAAYARIPRPGTVEGDAVRDVLVEQWRGSWVCNSMAPNAAWGIYDDEVTQEWLAQNDTLHEALGARDLLIDGRAGLRVGNVRSLVGGEWSTLFSPSTRRVPPAIEERRVGQRWCAANARANASRPLFNVSYVDRFVDDLFPMAQSVLEATPLATCARVAMEAARMRALQLAYESLPDDVHEFQAVRVELAARVEVLDTTVAQWRRQCRQQLDALALCSVRGLFDSAPVDEAAPTCPFTLLGLPEVGGATAPPAWLTPSCLLRWTDGKHYDPCRCLSCDGSALHAADVVHEGCRLHFDPRALHAPARAAGSLWWPTKFSHVAEAEHRAALETAARNAHVARDAEQLGARVEDLLEQHARAAQTSFGNTQQAGSWPYAEGAASESTSFCDAIHDWWPEEYDHPAGVHPTTPCGADEIAYRGFAQSFTLDRAYNPPRIVFQHAAAADREAAADRFGTVGACRVRTIGMPQQVLNNMRFCTRLDTAARADAAVPLKPDVDAAGEADVETTGARFLEACAPDARGTPWRVNASEGLWQTAGLLLEWPERVDGIMLWPPTSLHMRKMQQPEAADDGWGEQSCGLPPLRLCAKDSDCVDESNEGTPMRCLAAATGAGVCARAEMGGTALQCVQHADCDDERMCAGDGLCVTPVLMVNNTRWRDLHAHAFAESCLGGERVDTFGGSPWEQVPDVLQSHGLCSHRRWYEYRALMNDGVGCGDLGIVGEGDCGVRVDEQTRVHTDVIGPAQPPGRTLREEGVLSVHAHTCDRDFMFVEGYAECRPRKVLRRDASDALRVLEVSAFPEDRGAGEDGMHARWLATYRQRSNETLRMTRMPYFDNAQVGFIGTVDALQSKEENLADRSDSLEMQNCGDIPHCALQEFTVRGHIINRRIVRPIGEAAREYHLRDAVKCGAYGYLIAGRDARWCQVDRDVVPLLSIVCEQANTMLAAGCGFRFGDTTRAELCAKLTTRYSTVQRDEMRLAVNSLHEQFSWWSSEPSSQATLSQYMTKLQCSEQILDTLNAAPAGGFEYEATDGTRIHSVGLYYFTNFALYEIAPLWWVRCLLFSNTLSQFTPNNGRFGDEGLHCAAWGVEDSATVNAQSAHEWLALRAGLFDEGHIQARRHALLQQMVDATEEVLFELANRTGMVNDRLFNPKCFNRLRLDTARIANERVDMTEGISDAGSLIALLQTSEVKRAVETNTLFEIAWGEKFACLDKSKPCVISTENYTWPNTIDTAVDGFDAATADLARLYRNSFLALTDIKTIDALAGVQVRGDDFSELHVLEFLSKSVKTNDVQKREALLEQLTAGLCVRDDLDTEPGFCVYDKPSLDPSTGAKQSWKRWIGGDVLQGTQPSTTPFNVLLSKDEDRLTSNIYEPWNTNGERSKVQFDICSFENPDMPNKELRDGCGIPTRYRPRVSDWGSPGGDWAKALRDAGKVDYTNEQSSTRDRVFDINDPCLVGDDSNTKRPLDWHAAILEEQQHKATPYRYIRVPRGVRVRMYARKMRTVIDKNTARSRYVNPGWPYTNQFQLDLNTAIARSQESEPRIHREFLLWTQTFAEANLQNAAGSVKDAWGHTRGAELVKPGSDYWLNQEAPKYSGTDPWYYDYLKHGGTEIDTTYGFWRRQNINRDDDDPLPKDRVVIPQMCGGGSYWGALFDDLDRHYWDEVEDCYEIMGTNTIEERMSESGLRSYVKQDNGESHLFSHVPRVLSDAYDSIPRQSEGFVPLRLRKRFIQKSHSSSSQTSKDEYAHARWRGLGNSPMGDLGDSVFVPYAAPRWLWNIRPESRYHNGKVYLKGSSEYYRRSLNEDNPVAHVLFHTTQLADGYHDPEYASGLYADGDRMFMSFGRLRRLVSEKTGVYADLDRQRINRMGYGHGDFHGPGYEDKFAPTIKRVWFDRFYDNQRPGQTNGMLSKLSGTVVKHPDWLHATLQKHRRTLQQIVEARGETHADQPWVLLGQTFAQFKSTVRDFFRDRLKVFVRYRDVDTRDPRGVRWAAEDTDRWLRGERSASGLEYPWLKTAGERNADGIPFRFGTDDDSGLVRCDDSSILDEYVTTHLAEAKLLYIAIKWRELAAYWFEVYNVDSAWEEVVTFSANSQEGLSNLRSLGRNVVALRFEMENDFHCVDSEKENNLNAKIASLCGEGKVGEMVARNVARCTPCFQIRPTLCKGRHNCRPPDWPDTLGSALTETYVPQETETGFLLNTGPDARMPELFALLWNVLYRAVRDRTRTASGAPEVYAGALADKLTAPLRVAAGNTSNAALFRGRYEAGPRLTWDNFAGGFNPVSAFAYEKTTGVYELVNGQLVLNVEACADTQETNLVDYTRCDMNYGTQYLNESFFALHASPRGVRVPYKGSSAWTVSKQQWTRRGLLPFWADAEREPRDRFASWVLDDEAHCEAHTPDRLHSVCFIDTNNKIHVFNPWVGGDFSVADRCDSIDEPGFNGRRLHTGCEQDVCPGGEESVFADEQYTVVGFSCYRSNGKTIGDPIVRDNQRNNLCRHAPRPNSTCQHAQGTLAGPGDPAGSVYFETTAERALELRTQEGRQPVGENGVGGLFVEPRHIGWTGRSFAVGAGRASVLRIAAEDITGHHVRLLVDETGMRVESVHAGSHATLEEAEAQHARGTEWLQFDAATESRRATPTLSAPDGGASAWTDWACALRQQRFLAFEAGDFAPELPDLRRAQKAFHAANGGAAVHPTQAANAAKRAPKYSYASPNGVCACATPAACAALASVNGGTCTFLGTVTALHDAAWHKSEVRASPTGSGSCREQHDWPYAGGALRDDVELPRQMGASACDTLDRLPAYEFRWTSVPWVPASGSTPTTLDEGGVCHTGRLAEHDPEQPTPDAECTLLHRNDSHLVLRCEDVDLVLPRRARAMPEAVAASVAKLRRRCSQCSAPPTFHTRDGARIAPETSIGQPFRVSAERRLAARLRDDLADALCVTEADPRAGCAALDGALNHSMWVRGVFWEALMGDAKQLLNSSWDAASAVSMRTLAETMKLPGDALAADAHSGVAGAEGALWQEPWLFCALPDPQCEQVCEPATGVCEEKCANAETSAMRCQGTVDKDLWMNPVTRFSATTDAFTEVALEQDRLVQEMNVCDLNAALSKLCRGVQAARSMVFESNCFAAGACFREQFFYQPSLFSLSNNQFVRYTVRDFYDYIDKGACVDEASARSAELREQNAALIVHCPATVLQRFKEVLQMARAFCAAFVRAGYFLAMTILQAVRMILPPLTGSSEYEEILSSMSIYWGLFMAELGTMLTVYVDLIMQWLLGSGIGEWIEQMLVALCHAQNWVMETFYLGAYCPIATAIYDALMFFSIDIGEPSCDRQDAIQQCEYASDEHTKPIARVDVATRCWSTYVNTLGDVGSLSCSASDSCLLDTKGTLVACDECPMQLLPDFQRYGCDVVRKQCKCGVQSLERSACISHAQCVQDETSTCDMLDDAFSPLGFGTTPCVDCVAAEAMCIDAVGGARCACPMRAEPFQSCAATEIGQSIVPDPLRLCLIAMSSTLAASLGSSTAYAASYAELAAAPCIMVDITTTYCMTVYSSAWSYAPMVVALERLPVGRRLLNDETRQDDATVQRRDVTFGEVHVSPAALAAAEQADWSRAHGELCRALMAPNATLSGVTDATGRRLCVRWRAIGADVKAAFNLSVPDTFLLSAADFANALAETNLLVRVAWQPHIVPYVALHSEYARPARAALRTMRRLTHFALGAARQSARWFAESRARNATTLPPLEAALNATLRIPHTRHALLAEMRAGTPPGSRERALGRLMEQAEELLGRVGNDFDQEVNELLRDKPAQDKNASAARTLLAFEDTLEAVQAYSTKVALGDGATQILGADVDAAYAPPLNFPPISLVWKENADCFAVESLANLIVRTVELLVRYFSPTRPPVPVASTSLVEAFNDAVAGPEDPVPSNSAERSWIDRFATWLCVDVLRIPRGAVRRWLNALPTWAQELLVCDIDSVMFCSRNRYSLLVGALFVAISGYVLALLLASVGVPYTWTLFAIIYIPLIGYYCMGISPLCAPMVPVCLGDELISLFDLVLPARITLPLALQSTPGCIDDNTVSAENCVIPCSAYPYEYTDWARPLAWGVCEVGLCPGAHATVRDSWPYAQEEGQLLYPLSAALYRAEILYTQADEDVIAAHRFCALSSAWRALPLALALGAAAYVLPAVLMLPLQLAFTTMQLAFSAIPLAHMRVRQTQ